MNNKLNVADNLLLFGVIAVVAVMAFGVIGALIASVFFAIKIFFVVVAIGVGWKVVTSVTGGKKRGELNR